MWKSSNLSETVMIFIKLNNKILKSSVKYPENFSKAGTKKILKTVQAYRTNSFSKVTIIKII